MNRGIGSWLEGGDACFRAWAPDHRALEVVLFDAPDRPGRAVRMTAEEGGWFTARIAGAKAALLYKLRVDGAGPFPDPASRSQPFGVHGPSAVIDETFAWTDAGWRGVPLERLVVWEAHVGTATPEGTFDALAGKLAHVAALGATAIELMPVASFPGARNWGYDGVSLFAPHEGYGGAAGLRRLVDAAHAAGLAVIVDCVYNHFGPDGNYVTAYAKRWFSHAHATPWGDAIAFHEPAVREAFLENAAMWIERFHADGLRLDATHAIFDDSSRAAGDGRPGSPAHILGAIAARARAAAPDRHVLVIAEDERNDARLVQGASAGGMGLDAVWADDFHHAMRRAFAGDDAGYFADFTGTAEEIARILSRGWLYEGQISAHLGKPRGTSPDDVAPAALLYCIQNHDQIGNRALGDRLAVSPAAFRAMSALLLASPYTPLLFMGQEWNASTPFLYFTDHHAELGRAVTEGRRREHASHAGVDVPDPQAEATFAASKLDWGEPTRPEHAGALELYRELLQLRRDHPALRERARGTFAANAVGSAVVLDRAGVKVVCNVRGRFEHALGGRWRLLLSTEDRRFGGAGAARLDGDRVSIEGPGALLLEAD